MTYISEWDLALYHLLLPVAEHETTELLVERSAVGQEASSQQDIANQSLDLGLETLAGLCPPDLLSGQTIDESLGIVHLAPTCFSIIHQSLQAKVLSYTCLNTHVSQQGELKLRVLIQTLHHGQYIFKNPMLKYL